MATPEAISELLQKVLLGQECAEKHAAAQAAAQKERGAKQAERDEQHKECEAKQAAEQKVRDEQQKECEAKQAAEQEEREAQEESILAALALGFVSPSTPAQLGQQHMEALVAIGNVRVLEPHEGLPSILTVHQQAELAALPAEGGAAEAAIVRQMACLLRALWQAGTGEASAAAAAPLVMLNSEARIWLVHPAVHGVAGQPDLSPLTWAPLVEVRDGALDSPRGVLASPALQQAGCVAELYEAQSTALGAEAFGRQCLYHQCRPGRFKSALFNQSQCWLLETMHGYSINLCKMHWTTPGSVRELQRFMGAPAAPPLLLLLQRVLAQQQLDALSIAGRCHLGSGASGHVFAVHRTNDAARTPLALKLVLDAPEADLHAEFARMQAAVAAGAPVVAPVPGSLCIYSGSAAAAASAAATAEAPAPARASGGYLLSQVGERLVATTEGGIHAAFAALAALHACRVCHGDARTANLLTIEGRAVWIDLRTGIVDAGGAAALPLAQQAFDAAVLARSILPPTLPLPPSVHDALRLYNASVPGTAAALAKAVWGAM
jgi:hypothetical protein